MGTLGGSGLGGGPEAYVAGSGSTDPDLKDEESKEEPFVSEADKEESAAVEKSLSSDGDGDAVVGDDKEDPDQESYAPNYKYRVKDKELEFDESLRIGVTSKLQEEKLRELYTKASGIEEISESRNQLQSQHSGLINQLKTAGQYARIDDYDKVFELMAIDPKRVAAWVLEKVKEQDLTLEERSRYNQGVEARRSAVGFEQQNSGLVSQIQQLEMRQMHNEMQTTMQNPEVTSVEQAYDGTHGSGAFRKRVMQQGDYMCQATQRYVPPQEVVAALVAEIKPFIQLNSQRSSQSSSGLSNTVVKSTNKPTIPALGRGSSGTKPAVRTLEDLKKLASSFGNQNMED